MQLVIDANVLFAALIGKGKTQELVFEDKIKLVAPLKLIDEFETNKELIAAKGNVSVEELMESFELIRERIEIYATDGISSEIRIEAEKLAPQRKDVAYFALALHLGCNIWSRERLFKKQSKVRVLSTSDLIKVSGL